MSNQNKKKNDKQLELIYYNSNMIKFLNEFVTKHFINL